jgi:DNA-binding beta-propeller fold protein YncE
MRVNPSPDERLLRTVRAAASLLVMLAAACASTAAPRSARPGAALQWPPAPSPAKLAYLESLTGFGPARGGGSVWHAIVYGRGRGSEDGLLLPVAIARGDDGRLAVADLGRASVELFLPADKRHLRLTGPARTPLVSPVGVAFDGSERLYVTDSRGALFAFGADGAFLYRRVAAGSEKLERPTGILYSPANERLYVVDTLAARVDVLTRDGDLDFTFGHRGADAGELNFPTHVAQGADGTLFVTDTLNFRISMFDPRGRPLGSFGHHGDGSGDLGLPKGVAVDGDGVVYEVDALFDNVQLFDRSGRFLLTVGGRGTDFGEFWLPSGLYLGKDDVLYVCDTYNHRVQLFRVTRDYSHAMD